MSRLIETIRFSEGKLQNLDYHVRRIGICKPGWDVSGLLNSVELPTGIYKVRIVYDNKSASITTEPYTVRPVRSLKLVIDNNIVYDQKFEDRRELNSLFEQHGNCDDVLIVKNNFITDTSYSNIIFRKGNEWFTPDTFLLNGTMRQSLLDQKKIIEQPITLGNLSMFSSFKLINAMLRDEAPESEVSNIH